MAAHARIITPHTQQASGAHARAVQLAGGTVCGTTASLKFAQDTTRSLQGTACYLFGPFGTEPRKEHRPHRRFMGGSSSKVSHSHAKPDGRRVIVYGTSIHMETNGLYMEVSEPCDGKPQFVNMDHHKNRAPLVLSWSSAEQQWSIRKVVAFHAEKRVYYIASALTGADVSRDMPPTGAWVISGTVDKEEKTSG